MAFLYLREMISDWSLHKCILLFYLGIERKRMVKDKHDGNHLSQEAELDKGGVPQCPNADKTKHFGGLLETCK